MSDYVSRVLAESKERLKEAKAKREQAWTLQVAAFGTGFLVGTIAMALVGRF